MPFSLQPEEKVRRLQNQIGWITRLSAALSTTKHSDDILSLILTGVISPTCLGHSQVLYFENDPVNKVLAGRFGLTHESRESFDALAEELRDEEVYVETRRDSKEDTPLPPNVDDELNWLIDNSQWVTLSQRLAIHGDLTEKVRKLTLPMYDEEQAPFPRLACWRSSRAKSLTSVGEKLPAGLAQLLPEHFAVAPVHSQKGLTGVLIVDRRLEADRPYTNEELTELDWFSRQGALALENLEFSRDLRNAVADLKELDQLKSNFLSVISHELRTPLTSMGGFVDLILEERVGNINENQRTLLNRVAKNTQHLSHLVNDLIEVAQIEAEGTVEVTREKVEPLSVLMNTLPRLEERRRETDVHVEPVVECDVPEIWSDEKALGRIFFHLLDNAMKFSPPDSTVKVVFRTEEGEFFADVKDEGLGISREHIRHIFDYFFQADSTLTRGYEGLGLGLAVTKIMIQATKGRILVDSEEDHGSTFTVVYPIAK